MINQKELRKYSNKSRSVEKFASSKPQGLAKIVDMMPFFIKIPLQFYYSIFKKGLKNPIYLGLLFVWFVFMKKAVRINLEDTYRYKY